MTRSSTLSIAPAAEFASRFLRTVILSRFLVPEEFGTAVAISVVLGIAGLVTDVSLNKFAVVVENSNSRMLPAVHVLAIGRGTLVTLTLVVSARAAATLFGVPQFTSSFIIAAFIPLISSFSHLEIKQVQRDYVYLPDTLAIVFANLAALLILIPAVALFRDHRAIIASFMTEAAVYAVASHAFAREPYLIRSDPMMLRAALRFGLPLLVNGIGLAVMTQMDRALIGHWFGVDKLASYAVIVTLSITPVSLLLRVFGTTALSYLVSASSSYSIQPRHYHLLIFFFGLVAVFYTLFEATLLDVVTPLVFGGKYIVDPIVHVLITAIVFLRIQTGGAPTTLLLATSQTRELAAISLSRALGLACAYVFMLFQPGFGFMLFGFLIGDIVIFVLFFGVSSARVSPTSYEGTVDLAASLVSAVLICGTLYFAPAIVWQFRALIFAVGLLGIATQLLLAGRNNGPLRTIVGGRGLDPAAASRGRDDRPPAP